MQEVCEQEVGEDEARAALTRILASAGFRAAPRLAAFLAFVVERTLAGEGTALKGYTIATGALGRGPDFDPAADPIVRVEAGRLRRALAAYYAGPGAGDPVVVSVPRGGYAPLFRAATPIACRPAEEGSVPRRVVAPLGAGRRGRWIAAPAVAAGLALLLGSWSSAPPRAGPTVLLVRAAAGVPERLRDDLVEALAGFDDLTVIDGAQAPRDTVAAYLLALRPAGDGTVAASLRHRASGAVRWARRYAVDASADRIAAAVAGPGGALRSDQGAVDPRLAAAR